MHKNECLLPSPAVSVRQSDRLAELTISLFDWFIFTVLIPEGLNYLPAGKQTYGLFLILCIYFYSKHKVKNAFLENV